MPAVDVYDDEETPPAVELHPYIIAPLQHLAVPVASLKYDPDNVRVHDRKNLDAIEESLRRFKQRLPLFADEGTRIVRVGNGRLRVIRERLKWTHVACIIHKDSRDLARAFALADNRTSELGDWDYEGLARQLAEFAKLDGLTVGWDESDMEPLLRSAWVPPALDTTVGVHTDDEFDALDRSEQGNTRADARKTTMQRLGAGEFRDAINKIRGLGGRYVVGKATDVEIVQEALEYLFKAITARGVKKAGK